MATIELTEEEAVLLGQLVEQHLNTIHAKFERRMADRKTYELSPQEVSVILAALSEAVMARVVKLAQIETTANDSDHVIDLEKSLAMLREVINRFAE